MGKSTKKPKKPSALIAGNKRAYHDYHISDTFTAGVVLTGSEIKSLRARQASMNQAFVKIIKGEAFLHGLYIAPYEKASYNNHDPHRIRKLLLTKREIERLDSKTKEKGLTILPIRLFFKRAWVKVDIGLGKGKQLHDKRADIAKKDQKRAIDRMMKSHTR